MKSRAFWFTAILAVSAGLTLEACTSSNPASSNPASSNTLESQSLFPPPIPPAGALERTGWNALYGPASQSDLAGILDNSLATSWISSANQDNSMGIHIDLGAERSFDKLVLEAGAGSANFLRSLNVFLSSTPGPWGRAVKSVEGVNSTRLELDLGAQSGRYITLQSGSANPGVPWSIAELWLVNSAKPAPFAVKRSINIGVVRDDKIENLPLPQSQVSRFKTAGFDSLRVMTDPAIYMDVNGNFIAGAVPGRNAPALDTALRNALDAGLKVVVDLHSYENFPGTNTQFNQSVLCKGAMPKYERFLEQLARYLATQYSKSDVALELMNEPNTNGCDGLDYPPQLKKMYDAARRGSSDLTLVLSPLGNSSVFELQNIAPLPSAQNPDPNTIYTVHYYSALAFTHQTASWDAKKFAFLSRIPYPASTSSFAATWPRIKASIENAPINNADARPTLTVRSEAERAEAKAGAEAELRCYFDGDCWYGKGRPAGRGDVIDAANRVKNWTTQYNIPPSRIWLGEFGALGDTVLNWVQPSSQNKSFGAAPEDRARWTKDVRDVFEQYGFGWAYFAYCCGGFGIVSDPKFLNANIQDWNPSIVDALGLTMP